MSAPRFVLRNLPGIAQVEALIDEIYAHPNPAWAPGADRLQGLISGTSRSLFGITEEDTYFPPGLFEERDPERRARMKEAWGRHFAFLNSGFLSDEESESAERLIWEAMGWDVTDGRGKPLRCLHYFQEQMVCATKGLCGRLPGEASELEAAETAEAWGEALLRR